MRNANHLCRPTPTTHFLSSWEALRRAAREPPVVLNKRIDMLTSGSSVTRRGPNALDYSCLGRSRERLEHLRQGPGDLVNDERNAEHSANVANEERTHDKEASRRPAVGTDRATGLVDIASNAERRDTAETVVECSAQKWVVRGVGAGKASPMQLITWSIATDWISRETRSRQVT